MLLGCNGVIGATSTRRGGRNGWNTRTSLRPVGLRRKRRASSGDRIPATHPYSQRENSVREELRPGGNANRDEPSRTPGQLSTTTWRALRVSSDLWGDYQEAAETLAEAVTSNATVLAGLLPGELPSDPSNACAHWLATSADVPIDGRCPVRRSTNTPGSSSKARRIFPDMSSFDSGVRVLLEAFLQSPHFLYRVELGQSQSGNTVQLSEFEIASRLSFMIWNSGPDDSLLDQAEQGALNSAEQIANQAERLLDDPRGRAMLERFHAQLFNWDLYRDLSKNPAEFPLYYGGVGQDMYEEARRFVEHVVETDGDFAELLTAPYTFVNADLASIYGLDGAFGDSFSQASFDGATQPERGGLLTQLGFLASHGGLTGSVHRGVFINHRVLCTELPPPPDAIPPIPGDEGVTMTSRERIEMHTGPGTCGASCHGTYINPVGYAFESFDGLGQYRTEELGLPIDSAATFEFADGTVSFDGAAELNEAMTERIQTHDCYSKHWVEYALGRDTAGSDLDLIQYMGDASLGGLSIRELILELVQSDEFRARNAGGS